MIFISAQPDEYYFLWQLELQIINFKSFNIPSDQIHILFSCHDNKRISTELKSFKKKHKDLHIHIYPDTRENKNYLSSLRPHILAKHLQAHPDLCEKTFFYHDSDIIFSKLPNFEILLKGDTWYASDTRGYIDSNYILETAGEKLFIEMCRLVSIDPQVVKQNDHNAGGAQYLIKKPSVAFWQKVESDCEKVYTLLDVAEKRLNRNALFADKPFIQKWCTDMWVLWWNAILDHRPFEIHTELNFCWANSPIMDWHGSNILHYTGNVTANGPFFRKGDFILHPPFHERFTRILPDSCSFPLITAIDEFRKVHLVTRHQLNDLTFLIPIKIDSEDRLKNIYTSTSYIAKHFRTNIIVMEVDKSQKIDPDLLPKGTKYIFKQTNNLRLFRTQINNQMIKMCNTKFIALYDADVIIPVKQVVKAMKILRQEIHNMVSPYNGTFFNMDILLKEMFIKFQDDQFLEANKFKAGQASRRSFGGCIFLNKAAYVQAGMENENLTSWGPDDVERVKRMQILGHRVIRIEGSLFHLHHQRKVDSGYQSRKEYEDLMLEYLNISSMDKNELQNHIKDWKWTAN